MVMLFNKQNCFHFNPKFSVHFSQLKARYCYIVVQEYAIFSISGTNAPNSMVPRFGLVFSYRLLSPKLRVLEVKLKQRLVFF